MEWLISKYHYLGYCPQAGAQIRYIINSDKGLLGALSFSASAWKVASRDKWIGWNSEKRENNLHLIVNNSRFLILPWIRITNLASKILSMCNKKVVSDFNELYGYKPLLFETFVEQQRFSGTCYKASNWVRVGETTGRGKKGRSIKATTPIKDVYMYPINQRFRHLLEVL